MRTGDLRAIEEELREELAEGAAKGLTAFEITSRLLWHERQRIYILSAALSEILNITREGPEVLAWTKPVASER